MGFISTVDTDSKKILSYSISAATSGADKQLKKIHDTLVFHKQLSIGNIYLQSGTNDHWFINAENTIATLISKDRVDLFYQWDDKELLPTESQMDILSDIGGLPSPEYSFDPNYLEFPCKIKTIYGQSIDLCILYFSAAPPTHRYFKNLLLLDEVAEIYPSEYALAHHLRLSSMLADEIRMGFYPFAVETTDGGRLTYNGITHFASTDGGWKGSDIVRELDFNFNLIGKVQNHSVNEYTYVIGKWDDRMKFLFDSYNAELSEYSKSGDLQPFAEAQEVPWWKRVFS